MLAGQAGIACFEAGLQTSPDILHAVVAALGKNSSSIKGRLIAMNAQNTFQVFDWLWSSGQLSESDIEQLPGLGFAAVINLALPTSSNALKGEAELITGKGLCYFHIPVVWERPEIDQLRIFFKLLDSLEGKKVWVHCALNMRVSAFIYLYRKLRLNADEASASFPMKHIWQPNEIWRAFIENAENSF